MKFLLVPLMAVVSGALMSFAWIGHLKYASWSFLTSLVMSWLIVLPEYLLNVASARWGRPEFSGGQIAAIHLASGVICVALVSTYHLGETLTPRQIAGFALMGAAVLLIVFK